MHACMRVHGRGAHAHLNRLHESGLINSRIEYAPKHMVPCSPDKKLYSLAVEETSQATHQICRAKPSLKASATRPQETQGTYGQVATQFLPSQPPLLTAEPLTEGGLDRNELKLAELST
eukprot:894819-Pelagomonas_calceolata.AAC.5